MPQQEPDKRARKETCVSPLLDIAPGRFGVIFLFLGFSLIPLFVYLIMDRADWLGHLERIENFFTEQFATRTRVTTLTVFGASVFSFVTPSPRAGKPSKYSSYRIMISPPRKFIGMLIRLLRFFVLCSMFLCFIGIIKERVI
eukprot:GHVT01025096.1.p1 GENE.GHVT01025096.1~~GHVT01025096.1.p1  ORF type:complete len:142 (+),score=3.40 GHVT01025096.1:1499-1924(+)